MAICAQIIKLDDNLTRVLMVSLELNRDRNKQVRLKAVDSAPGSHYECHATSIDSSGTLAYFLLNDSESHKT